ncbi:MAG: hypothetical protein IJM30_10190 [Thermoguttaceae bacterium]|nr:hypothetical protein [Thermoguttaceae bacterium]
MDPVLTEYHKKKMKSPFCALLILTLFPAASFPTRADEPSDTYKIIEYDFEDEILEQIPEFATRPPASERTSLASAVGELRELFSSDREVLKIETSNSSFRYGEDIYFKLCFADDIELAERKEIMEKLLQCGSFLKIWLRFKDNQIDYNGPLPRWADIVREWGLHMQDGIPNYFRMPSENVYHSAASSARRRGDETDFDNTEPMTVQIELELVGRGGRIATFASSEITVDSPFQDYDRVVKDELANKRSLFKSQEANLRRFRISLLNNREEPALNELYRLSDSLVEDKFARGFFIQRVVRTLHKFMGLDKCPELQKKLGQYEEELGLIGIQY